MKLINKALFSVGILGATAISLSAASISVNFSSDREVAELAPGDSAGAPGYVTSGWNNVLNIPANVPTPPTIGNEGGISGPNAGVISDDSGTGTAVTMSWSSVNAWNTTNGIGNPDNTLMNGYIDNNGNFPNVSIDLANIPYSAYDLVVYFGSDGDDRTGTVSAAGTTYSYSTFSHQGGGPSFPAGYIQTTDTGAGNPRANYAVWSGLTGSSLEIDLDRGSSNSGIHGFQIIEVPEPSVSLLIGLGGMLLMFRRRR